MKGRFGQSSNLSFDMTKRHLRYSQALAALLISTLPAAAQNLDVNGILGGILQGQLQRASRVPKHFSVPLDEDDTPTVAPVPQEPYPYSVDGLKLGASQSLPDDFKCHGSEQFKGFSWCQKFFKLQTPNGMNATAIAILRGSDNKIVYISKSVSPATFKPGEVMQEVNRISSRFQNKANIIRFPNAVETQNGIIVIWGSMTLTKVDEATAQEIADGKTVNAGILIDFLGNFRQSAKNGLPIFRIGGGPGYFWVSNYDQTGKGNLRFGTADASQYEGPQSSPKVADSDPTPVEDPNASLRSVDPPVAAVAPVPPVSKPQDTPIRPTTPSGPFVSLPTSSNEVEIKVAPRDDQNESTRFLPKPEDGTKSSPIVEQSQKGSKTVEVSGFGNSVDAARQDAARLAVQEVAGVYIDNKRRVEESITDNKVKLTVDDKILSFTNAYVSHLEVISVGQKDGIFEVKASVSVSISPLLHTLQENAIPVVAFDSQSSSSTAETLSDQKSNALNIYLDLLKRVDSLVKIGVGKPEVDTSMPSPPNETWIKIPITYFSNDEAIKEWHTKFSLIAEQHAQVNMPMMSVHPANDTNCFVQQFAPDTFISFRSTNINNILTKRLIDGQLGVAACFSIAETPKGIDSDCFTRVFVLGDNFNEGNNFNKTCNENTSCPSFGYRRGTFILQVDFLGADNSSIYRVPIQLSNFPQINVTTSHASPHDSKEKIFFDFCKGRHDAFFYYESSSSVLGSDVILFPRLGSKIDSFLNVKIPNDKLSNIRSVKASIERNEN